MDKLSAKLNTVAEQLSEQLEAIQKQLREGATATPATATALNINENVMRLPAEDMEEFEAWESDLGDADIVKTVVIKKIFINKL